MDFFSNVIGFLPEIVAVVSAFIAWQSKLSARNSVREANQIQQRLLDIEAERRKHELASLQQASFGAETLGRQDDSLKVFIRNVGNSSAYKAQFFADDTRIDAYPTFKGTSLKRYEPTLEVQSVTTFEFELKSYLPYPKSIAVIWIDETGKLQRQRLEILKS